MRVIFFTSGTMSFDSDLQSVDYLADHITRIEGRHAGNHNLVLDSKRRIASHCDMQLLETQLTLGQEKEVDEFITKFKDSFPKEIAKYRSKNQ